MSIKLVKLSKEYKTQLEDMLKEWIEFNNTHETNKSPGAIFKNDYHDFDYYLENLDYVKPDSGLVPSTTLFLYDEERNIFIGAANIRHFLNDDLLATGGHIGDGIRPSERRKGYGTLLIKLALEECKKLGIDRVLITCNDYNIGSRKAIISNGGILENIVKEDNENVERYWIENK